MAVGTLQRYSVYDHMERKGLFAVNPANVGARDSEGKSTYKGPVAYPKMFYSPMGEEVQVTPESIEVVNGRDRITYATFTLVTRVVEDAGAEKLARAEGWHDHPSKSIAAGNEVRKREGLKLRVVPSMSLDRVAVDLAEERDELKDENEQLRAEIEQLRHAAHKAAKN